MVSQTPSDILYRTPRQTVMPDVQPWPHAAVGLVMPGSIVSMMQAMEDRHDKAIDALRKDMESDTDKHDKAMDALRKGVTTFISNSLHTHQVPIMVYNAGSSVIKSYNAGKPGQNVPSGINALPQSLERIATSYSTEHRDALKTITKLVSKYARSETRTDAANLENNPRAFVEQLCFLLDMSATTILDHNKQEEYRHIACSCADLLREAWERDKVGKWADAGGLALDELLKKSAERR